MLVQTHGPAATGIPRLHGVTVQRRISRTCLRGRFRLTVLPSWERIVAINPGSRPSGADRVERSYIVLLSSPWLPSVREFRPFRRPWMSLASDLSLSSSKLAGIRRRSDASHGGLLNRMFGSSSLAKEKAETLVLSSSSPSSSATGPTGLTLNTANLGLARDKRLSPRSASFLRSPGDDATTPTPTSATSEKKHRSFSVAKAASFFYSAKETLRFSHRDSTQSPHSPRSALHKLGKMDPALSVPQGSLNNSAGESRPTPRSSFQVGVTEDRNRKCRRTMEDTHAYLYNFMGTPAPGRKASPTPDGGESPTESGSNADDSTHVVETDNGYFAIFDGHAGTFAAEWCGKKLHLILEDIMRRNPNTPVPELLDQAFTSVDRELEKLPLKNSGCTAVAAVLRWEDRMPSSSQSAQASGPAAPAASSSSEGESKQNPESPAQKATLNSQSNAESNPSAVPATPIRQRVLYTANVGDARIVLCRNGKALRLSYDHKGGDENEGRRIANAGGLILNNRVNGVLAVTRALGDAYLKDLVTGHPYTTETVIHPDQDEFLILACDGVSEPP